MVVGQQGSDRNFYDVLGVTRTNTKSDIRYAYLRGARRYHPDRKGPDAPSHEDWDLFYTAYTTLHNDTTRALYDYHLDHGPQAPTQNSGSREQPLLAVEGNETFREMELAVRMSVASYREVIGKKQRIEALFRLPIGSLRFHEGLPCNGESCCQGRSQLFRISDPEFLPKEDSCLLVCLKHKYLHLCGDQCSSVDQACPIAAWHLAERFHRHRNAQQKPPSPEKLLQEGKKQKESPVCKQSTCAPKAGHNERGFVALRRSVWVCKQHPRPHMCEVFGNHACEFMKRNGDMLVCWATGREDYSPIILEDGEHEVSSALPQAEGADLRGRLRMLEDGTATFVPWGLNVGTAIEGVEESQFALIAARNQKIAEQDLETERVQERKALKNGTKPSASVYHQYIGLLEDENLPDELGDYVTLHHGRMGGDEGGTGYEGFEDDVEEQKEAEEERHRAFLESGSFATNALEGVSTVKIEDKKPQTASSKD